MQVNLIKYSKFYILKIDNNNIFIYDELLTKDFHITDSITHDVTTISLVSPGFEIKYDVGHDNIIKLRNLIQQFIEPNIIVPKIIAVEPKEYKILLVGNSGVGKTSFIRSLQVKPFNGVYNGSSGITWVIIKSLTTGTNFKIYDIYNPDRQTSLYSEIYDTAIIMYDTSSKDDNNKWYQMIKKRQEKIPIVTYHNKCDFKQRAAQLCYLHDTYVYCYEMSVKNNIGVLEAFNGLERLCEKIEK